MVVAVADLADQECCGPCTTIARQAAWYIDARTGSPADIIGDVDAVPMNGTLMVPADGAVQFATLATNEGPAGFSYMSTPDSAANSITGDIDIRAVARSIDDPTNAGIVPQAVKVAKFLAGTPNTFDYLFSLLIAGDLRLAGLGALSERTVPADISLYTMTPLRVTRDAGTGVVEGFIENDADYDVTTADGRHWQLLGSDSSGGPGPLEDTPDMILTFMIGKGVGGWCQVYDGIDGTLVVDMDVARDAPGGLADGGTFTAATGETWTVGEFSATFDIDANSWLVGNTEVAANFEVPDAASVDLGTADFTLVARIQPSSLATGGADFRPYVIKANPATIGSTGVGWALLDFAPLGGLVFGINDGSGLVFVAGPWTAFDWHLVVVTGDRDGLMSLYIDDMTTAVDTSNIAGTAGTLSNALDIASLPRDPALLQSALIYHRLLDADERTHLADLLVGP